MVRTFSILFFSLFLMPTGFSQGVNAQTKTDLFGDPFNSGNQMMIRALSSFEDKKDNTDFFVLSEWSSMDAYGKDGQHIIADSANVVINGGKILFYSDGELLQLFGSITKEVRIDGKLFLPYPSNSKSMNGTLEFFEVLVDGKFRLVREWKVEERLVSDHPMGLTQDSKSEIVRTSKLYFVNKKGDLEIVPRRKKDFVLIFGRDKTKMIDFAKKNKISVKDDSDVALSFEHYNKVLDAK